ncbi:hypothetical protein V502_08820 [Pseudogymnoascus sp. VKM F-4520 (FW-2644)]|nr:hypothetical protein V502_08820 [Pseudogymnoascus sp. VKM F-4520 (FW-2644)]
MSEPPPDSGREKKPELSQPPGQSPRQKTAKHTRPWNSGISPEAKGKSTASPSKQPSKQPPKQTLSQPQQQPQRQLPKHTPKHIPKQAPKQVLKQTPKQLPKDRPKELLKQISKQPPKQPTKVSSSRSSAPRNTGEGPPSSLRGIHKRSPFQKRDYDTAATLDPPARKPPAPVLKETKVGSLPDSDRSLAKDDEYFSSLLKRSSLNLSPPSKDSDTYDIPLQDDKGPGLDQICNRKAHLSGVPSSGMEARCLFHPRFTAESYEEQTLPPRFTNETVICERVQPSRRMGKLRSPVGTPEDESNESWLPADSSGGNWQLWRPPQRLRNIEEPIPDPVVRFRHRFLHDSVDELRGVPMRATFVPGGATPPARRIEATYPNPEAHTLAIDPNIMLHIPRSSTPRSRRSMTVSDPVHPSAPMHDDHEIYIAQMMQNDDHAFRMMPKVVSQFCADIEPQDSKGIYQPADQESAYQAMLKKAHYKPDQTHQPKPLHEGRHPKSEKREKDAPFSQVVIQKVALEEDPEIHIELTPATIGRYLQPSSQNIIRANGSVVNGVADKPQKAEPKRYNTTRKSRAPHEPSPIYKPIREPLSPNKHNSLGRAESSYTSDGWFVGQQVQQKQDGKVGSSRPNSTNKSSLDPAENGHHSAPPALLPAVDHSPSISSPRRMQNKSVSWDPAITLICPVKSAVNERPTAEAMFERLFVKDGEKGVAEGQEMAGDKDVDAFVSTFKRWKKGDRNKLDSLLKALRNIEADTDTDSANGEKVDEDIQNGAPGQNATAGFDPRVPDFKPLIFRENEIWVPKVRSHTPATLSASAARPIAPATINIPFRAAPRGRPPWPITGKFQNVVVPYQHSLSASTRPSSGCDSQPVKKRVIWDNPEDPGGREAVMQSQRWAGELLERFTMKYPLTGQKATIVPKKRLEDLPISRLNINTLKVAKMVSDAADIQQKLEVLLMQKKEAKARGIR